SVSFPTQGVIRLQSRSLFGDADNPACRRFLERVFQAVEITNVTILGGSSPQAELRYCPKAATLEGVVQRIVAFLRQGSENGEVAANDPSPESSNGHALGNGHAIQNGYASGNGHAMNNGHASDNGHASAGGSFVPHSGYPTSRAVRSPQVAGAATARDK